MKVRAEAEKFCNHSYRKVTRASVY